MAHFAKLGINGKVIAVHVVNNSDILDANGQESEKIGQEFLERLHGWPKSMWIQTSYNTRAGMLYDEDNDIFRPKQPYASWTLDTTTGHWVPPTPQPITNDADGNEDAYTWNETNQVWDKVVD